LVVDDSAVSRELVASVLGQLPAVELVLAQSSAEALRAINEGDISLVICDYEMPDMSGLQVLRFVRGSQGPIELPVLMLTSTEDSEVKVKAFRYGANDYIGKHAAPEELLARVGTQIALLQAHRRLNNARLRRTEHQKFEAIGHLAQGLAHELNTPAQYIQDNLSFLAESFDALGAVIAELRQLPSAAERSLVEAVLERVEYNYLATEIPRCIVESKQGMDHVARVVAVMREFARPGLPERNEYSLNEIINGALAVTHGQWHQVAKLELTLSDALPNVRCIGVAIKQVVLYALLNAVKAMAQPVIGDSAKGVLRVATRFDAPNWALIEVEDNGRGMADATIQRVLDPVLSSMSTSTRAASTSAPRRRGPRSRSGSRSRREPASSPSPIRTRRAPGGEPQLASGAAAVGGENTFSMPRRRWLQTLTTGRGH
jgi:DNA-binding response OmpR family regulator